MPSGREFIPELFMQFNRVDGTAGIQLSRVLEKDFDGLEEGDERFVLSRRSSKVTLRILVRDTSLVL